MTGMFIERMDLRSFAVFVLVLALFGAVRWYTSVPRRRERLWRVLARRWGEPRPARRFHPLRRRDVARAAGRSALVGVALGAVSIGVAWIADRGPTRGPTLWLDAISFMAILGAALAFALASAQLIGAARFRGGSVRLPFTVLSNDIRIGSAGFVAYDDEREVFAGPFVPEPAFEQVYPIVRLLSEAYPDIAGPDARRSALDEYMAKKDALKLELLDAEGILVPAREISILDFTVPGGVDVFRIDVEASYGEWERRGLVERNVEGA
ncbi:MAG TPA: hypothetical protein VF761_07945 [Gemmatimonadaceae bacterium]